MSYRTRPKVAPDGQLVDLYRMLANASTSEFKSKIGLEKALNLVGLDWFEVYGPPHNAFADAYNTMRLYMFLSKCLKGAVSIKLG